MKKLRPKRSRRRLDADSYGKLRVAVLRRDAWRCQGCGSAEHLQVHHIQRRSDLGDDEETNLITLCADCHRCVHRRASY